MELPTVPLKEYLERIIDERTNSQAVAFVEFKSTLNHRLEGMNEFRAQLEKQEKEYLRKESYNPSQDLVLARLSKLEDRQGMMVGGVILLGVLIPLLVHYIK